MKFTVRKSLSWLLLAWATCNVCVVVAKEGIEYSHLLVPRSSSFGWLMGEHSVHVVQIDPTLYEIKAVRALDDGLGRETVFAMQERYGAVAAINGGFFAEGGTWDGRPCGALKIFNWLSLPTKPRGCIGWSLESTICPCMDRLGVKVVVETGLYRILADGLNRDRQQGEMIVYTPSFHRSTLTRPDGEEVLVVGAQIQSIVPSGNASIQDNGYVISIQEENPYFGLFEPLSSVSIRFETESLTGWTTSDQWRHCDYIVGGTPLLLHDGLRVVDWQSEEVIQSFLTHRHARTAIGVLENGHWVFVAVDRETYFDGMTMEELSDLMAALGCVDALNLDGGKSSTLVFDQAVKNVSMGVEEMDTRSQKALCRVSDAILAIPRLSAYQISRSFTIPSHLDMK
jgi:hypothetical protein